VKKGVQGEKEKEKKKKKKKTRKGKERIRKHRKPQRQLNDPGVDKEILEMLVDFCALCKTTQERKCVGAGVGETAGRRTLFSF